MKTILVLAIGLIAGCATTPAPEEIVPSTEPYHAEGTYWVKPSDSSTRVKHEIPFTANATNTHVVAKLTIGSTYVVETPASILDIEAELFDASGASLSKAARTAGGPATLTLDGKDAARGVGKLVLATFGGSGGGSGDYVKFVLDATA